MNFSLKFILMVATLLAGASVYARSNTITCLDKTQDVADQKLGEALSQRIVAMLEKKGIHLRADGNSISVSGAQVNFETDGIYGYFSLSDQILTTDDGTELIAEYKQTEWNSYKDAVNIYMKPVLNAHRFDKEGNALGGHCTLISDGVRVDNRAEFILVSNTKTGRVIGRVSLPSKISVY